MTDTVQKPTEEKSSCGYLITASADVFAFILFPAMAVLYLIASTDRPRAVICFTATGLTVDETSDDGLGRRVTRRTWPLGLIGQLRHHQFEPGIWLTISGKECHHLLKGVPAKTAYMIADALVAARQRLLNHKN